MNFIKFAHWFWNEKLEDGSERRAFILVTFVAGLCIACLLSLIFGIKVILWYFFGLIITTSLCLIIFYIVSIYYCYREWEDRIFNKLRDKN